MISLPLPAAACLRATLLACLAALSLGGALSARAADEPDAGGTFTTPGYPPRTPPAGSPAPGTAGTGNAQQSGTAARTPGASNGAANPRGSGASTRPGNGNDVASRRAEMPPPKPGEFQRF